MTTWRTAILVSLTCCAALGVAAGQPVMANRSSVNRVGTNLLTNPSFEQPGVNDTYATVTGTYITGWVIPAGKNVDYTGTYWRASDGIWSVDLDGTYTTGAIAQTFATTAGTQYTVTFDLAGNYAGGPAVKQMQVLAAGQTSPTFTFDVTGRSSSNMGWVTRTWCFTASGSTTTLEFRSLNPTGNSYGAAIDNVWVTAGGTAGCSTGGGGGGGTQELAGWWKLDEGSGTTVNDSSGLGNHGRVVGTPSWTSGSNGGAFSFDGSTYVEGTSTGTQFPRGSAARTITAWVKMNPVASDSSIFHYGDTSPAGNLHLYIGSTGKPGFGNGDRYGTIAAANTVTDNVWHHVAAVYEGPSTNAAKIYVDGTLQGSGTLSSAPNTGTSLGWRIGSFLLGAGKIKAVIDDVRLYTRSLSGDEIRTLGAGTGTFPPQCGYAAAPTSINASLAGGTYQIGVVTSGGCPWTATSSAPWITFDGPSSGTGPAILRVAVAVNGGSLPRTGTVTIAGTTVTVTQAPNNCEFAIRGDPGIIPGPGASEASIIVTASAASCPWSVSSSASWVTILRTVSEGAAQANSAPFSGSGSGTAYIRVDANPGVTQREGAIRITLGGTTNTYPVRQDVLSCSLTLDRYRDDGLSTDGGESRTISVNLSHSLCRWKASALAAGVISITPASGTGSGTLTYTTKPQPMGNPAFARITFCSASHPSYDLGCQDGYPYEKAFEVRLEPNCTYSLSPDRADDVPAAGAEGSFGVRTNYGSCSITATSNASWIKILAPNPPPNQGWGAGLNYRVEANTSTSSRTGTISVGKQNLEFRVSQLGVACEFGFLYDALDLTAAAYSSQLEVQTNGDNCSWTVRVGSDATDWLKITSNPSGRGKGLISFSVAENTSTNGRTGAIIVGRFAFEVRQAGAAGTTTPGGQTGGDSGKVQVDQNSNIYGAGHKTPPASSKGAPGLLPVEVKLPANSAGKVFVVTKATASTGALGPNGSVHDDYYMLFRETGGLSAIKAKAHISLTGVFLDDSEPSGAAPEMLVFRPQVPYFALLRPSLRQVFFIGDGQNDGKNREFVIPAGATRLFLGTTSGYSDDIVCCFDRLNASWSVEYSVKDAGARPAFETVAVEYCYNIYGAGHQQTPSHPEGRPTGDLPLEVKLPADAPGKPLIVTRAVPSQAGGFGANGYRHNDYIQRFLEAGGIAGIGGNAHIFLTGVFLDNSEPSPPAPEGLPDFKPDIPAFTSLSPRLRQPFYIGDGQIEGKPREFTVPYGATRLFLGTVNGYNNDIVSSFDRPGLYWLVDMNVKGSSTDTVSCYTLSPATAKIPARGGSYLLTINAARPECAVSYNASREWVRITGVSAAASGPVTVTYRVDGNTGAARTAAINVAPGVELAISQDAP